MTPSGIEPATFRFVARRLNHCATAVPHLKMLLTKNKWDNKFKTIKKKQYSHLFYRITNNLRNNLLY